MFVGPVLPDAVHRFIMDDPNITMEKYIRLEEEKARRQGRTFDWQTASYGKTKYYENEDDSFMDLGTEYPTIVLDDIFDAAFSREPTVSPLDKIDFNISFHESDDEDYLPSSQSPEPTCGYIDDLDFFKDFENEFPTIVYNDLKSKLDPLNEPADTGTRDNGLLKVWDQIDMAPLPYPDLRHQWLRYQVDGYDEGIVHSYEQRLETIWSRLVNRVHVLDFARLTDGMRQTLGDRLSMVYAGDDGQEVFTSHAWRRLFEVRGLLVREFILKFLSTCRMSDTEMGLDVADTLCFQLGGARRRMTWRLFILALGLHSEEEMAEPGFGAYWVGSERVISDKGDLRDYWIEISSSRDFLGPAPSYGAEKVTGVDLSYLWTMDRGTANIPHLLAQYLFHHVDGRKSGARLSGCHFIGRLATHFGLVGDQGLRGLFVVVSKLPVIDLHELARLNICARFGDTWAWVAPRPERQ
ncbi:hypothetical protein Tco_0464956 [Tanacetum coccineum]